MCATTGVRHFRGRRLYSTGGRILKMQSSYNSTVDGNNTHLFLPIRLLGTITRGVLRLYTQLEAILDSVPAVMA